MAASPQLQAVIDQLRTNNEAAAAAGLAPTVEGVRQMMAESLFTAPVPAGVTVKKVRAVNVPCEWVYAHGADPAKRLLYLHGGGYAAGNLDTHRALCADISVASGLSVLNVDYRLAPEHAGPAQFDDALIAYRWMLDNGPAGEEPAARCFLAGDSAGGGLALATLLGIRDAGLPAPSGAALLSPWTDMTVSGESLRGNAEKDPMVGYGLIAWMAGMVTGEELQPEDPRISPLFGAFEGLPPLLIQVGEEETLLSDSLRVAEKAQAAGVEVTLERWPDVIHVWHALGHDVPEASQGIQRVGEYLRGKAA
ncbi:MAG: alpha/beta hydrolase fold domain-containing protein [Alphaproteobacteria bacterium]|nr:alpha/beta hydrolase fold domain-containing protein [Alphaproteobacteria bacterium]